MAFPIIGAKNDRVLCRIYCTLGQSCDQLPVLVAQYLQQQVIQYPAATPSAA
jgi:hypothetical protein